MDSSRLPGKPLADVGGAPLLSRLAQRLRVASPRIPPVLAITSRPCDNPLAVWAAHEGTPCYRSDRPVEDVAGRFVDAAARHGSPWAFRVNGDSPLTDATLLDAALDRAQEGVDLVTNLSPRRHPYGIAVELVRIDALARMLGETSDPLDREHVTRVLYERLDPARIAAVPGGDPEWPNLRGAVDTAADLDRFRAFLADHAGSWPKTTVRQFVDWSLARSSA